MATETPFGRAVKAARVAQNALDAVQRGKSEAARSSATAEDILEANRESMRQQRAPRRASPPAR
jgi:hypothetical protein